MSLILWGGYAFLKQHQSSHAKAAVHVKKVAVKNSDAKKKEVKKEDQQYDFYTLLPKLKVSSGVKKSDE